jgi:branched-chain amino acid transport system permease protein
MESASSALPFVSPSGAGGTITISSLNQVTFGLLIIGFLLFEPLGLVEIWRRIRRYFANWPFSY